ncbi:MAG: hypothetical protein V2I33_24835 [Kangiellaceae bacterium]|jgi:hypothetical protein|nr:hypothetical protein [Kangiellaceae bacterium]
MKSLAECICEFYNPDEIYVAREMLWDVYGQPITACGAKKTRRVQPPADIQTARPFADDITSWVGMLVNSHPEEMCTKFYALDLRRVPPCPPEEINIFSVVARITALEKSLEASLNANASWPLPGDAPHGSRPQTANQFRSLPRESASKTMMRTDTQGATVNHTDPDPSWTKVIKKRTQKVEVRKKVRSAVKALPVVTGVGTDANLKGSTPVNHIFVNRVDYECTEETMRRFLEKKGVEIINIHKTSKEHANSASFRITVPKHQVESTLKADFWPCGIMCREWIRYIPKGRKPDAANDDAEDEEETDADDYVDNSSRKVVS